MRSDTGTRGHADTGSVRYGETATSPSHRVTASPRLYVAAIVYFLFSPLAVQAATYWVSPTGTSSWASCQSASDPASNYCSLGTANSNASAGDWVYLKGGTYSFSTLYATALLPARSGTSSAWITFKNAPGETPELKGTYGTRMWGLQINQSYIRIDGLLFTDFSDYLIRNGAHHVEVARCTFRNVTSPFRGGNFTMAEACIGGTDFRCYVSDLWVHHNTFYKLAAGGGCNGTSISEGGDAVRVGYPNGSCGGGAGVNCTTGANHHITIEDNYMAYAGHAVMDTYGTRQVIKNNVAHNEPWYPADNGACSVTWPATQYDNPAYNGSYSHRVWQITDSFGRDGLYNLVENNRLGFAGPNPNNDGADSLALASSRNIVRYNAFYGSMNNGLMPKYGPTGHGSIGGLNNRIFSNTVYKNGYGYPYYHTCTHSTCPEPQMGIHFYYPSLNTGNVIKNNIVYGNARAVLYGGLDIQDSVGNTVVSNWLTPNGDPLFVSPDLTQPSSLTLPDLQLRTNSPAIDSGTFLTQANGAGSNSVTLVVRDAQYFQDGTWGAAMAQGVTLFPDWIAVGRVTNVAQIRSIDYATNRVTLAAPLSWEDGAPIWLYRDSGGRQVLYGSAPDIGAHEFVRPPITAASCSQADVQAAVSRAERGDTISVPAGSCTWSNETSCGGRNTLLCLTQGIKLQGGIGGPTTITLNGPSDHGQIAYVPDETAQNNDEEFEITGFTLDGHSLSKHRGLLYIENGSSSKVISNIKIHHNTFRNSDHTGVSINGPVYGVAYLNHFINVVYSLRTMGRDAVSWALVPREYGTGTNFFIEDNTISFTRAMEGGLTDSGQGAPGYVYRYNTTDLANAAGLSGLWVNHGLQSMATSPGYTCPSGCGNSNCSPSVAGSCNPNQDSCEQWSTIKSEYYGNKIVNSPDFSTWMAHRGSWQLMFYNSSDSSYAKPYYAQYSCDSCQSPASPAYSQHVQNSYVWANYGGGILRPMTKGSDYCADAAVGSPYTITENVDYWNHQAGFNGTVGMGCGTLAARPATCTPGVGYWATDQSCTDLTGRVGASPASPISGTLYQCTAPNTWSTSYTPYPYPHPLRTGLPPPPPGGGNTPPAVPDLRGVEGRYFRISGEIAIPEVARATGFQWELVPRAGGAPIFQSMAGQVAAQGIVHGAPMATTAPRFQLGALNLAPGDYTLRVQATNAYGTSAWASAWVRLVSANLDSVRVYPNPWRSDRHSTRSVTFDSLTVNTEIKIFTVSGHHVKTLPTSSSQVTWDLTNESGDRVASGIYVYHLKAEGGAKMTGKVVVIK